MKKIFQYTLYSLLLMVTVCACSDDLDIQQVYSFDLVTMPVQKRIVENETVEIRCQIVREGNFSDTDFAIRYFQSEGSGSLRLDNGTVLLPNDLYPLDRTTFRLYFTALSSEQQSFDVYIVDSHNQVVQKTFSFQSGRTEAEHDELR